MGDLARTEVDPLTQVRSTVTVSFRIPKVGMRRRTFTDKIVVEDDVVNKAKAYLQALGLRKTYSREQTPKAIRIDLTRTGIIP
jgi:hypothetical protein